VAVIIDVVDQSYALCDGGIPNSVTRGKVNFKHLALTQIKVKINRSIKTSTLTKILVKEDVAGQWAKTGWAKKAKRQAIRANSTDFDRFNTMVFRQKRSQIINTEFNKLKKAKK
jgi:ribosomal protein L14E/L6E/L27E